MSLGGQYTYATDLGLSLSDGQIPSIVAGSIGTGKLPSDANGVYFVLTAVDVTASSGFLTKYCGWHTYASIGGAIKYSFVGNAAGPNLAAARRRPRLAQRQRRCRRDGERARARARGGGHRS